LAPSQAPSVIPSQAPSVVPSRRACSEDTFGRPLSSTTQVQSPTIAFLRCRPPLRRWACEPHSDAVTHGVRIRVESQLNTASSLPGRYTFEYFVHIVNAGAEPVQLVSRHWKISDNDGEETEVLHPTAPHACRTATCQHHRDKQSSPNALMRKLRIVMVRFGDRSLVIDRWANPKLSRCTCTCEYGVPSCRGKSAGVA
jgi:hypothetical protein